MLLVESIDNVVNWLAENVCSQIQLKLPDDYRNDADYDVKFVNPAAFPLYVPGKTDCRQMYRHRFPLYVYSSWRETMI